MDQQKMGAFIAKKRKEHNMSREELGAELGVSHKTIQKWENGKAIPDYIIIGCLCEELDITVAELMYGDNKAERSFDLYDQEEIIDMVEDIQVLKNENRFLMLMLVSISFLVFAVTFGKFPTILTILIILAFVTGTAGIITFMKR